MTLDGLDTDTAGFAFQRHPTVLQRLQRLPEDDLVVKTLITLIAAFACAVKDPMS
jgi:hypothetical protein